MSRKRKIGISINNFHCDPMKKIRKWEKWNVSFVQRKKKFIYYFARWLKEIGNKNKNENKKKKEIKKRAMKWMSWMAEKNRHKFWIIVEKNYLTSFNQVAATRKWKPPSWFSFNFVSFIINLLYFFHISTNKKANKQTMSVETEKEK